MQVLTVACDKCGSPVEVGERANYVTCVHCGSRLAVKRTSNSAYTVLISGGMEQDSVKPEHVELTTQQRNEIIKEKKRVRLNQELDGINQAWQKQAEEWVKGFHSGRAKIPGMDVVRKRVKIWSWASIALIVVVVFMFWALGLINNYPPVIPYVAFLGFALWKWKESKDDEKYVQSFDEAYEVYKFHSSRIIDELNKLETHP